MGSLLLATLAVAVVAGSALNSPIHGSAEDSFDYPAVRPPPGLQCDASDSACIAALLEQVPEKKSSRDDKFNFLSLITGKDVAGKEMEKRKDYTETEFKSHYLPSCACQTKYDVIDMGFNSFPRYLMNAVCLNREDSSRKCWRGSRCKEVPFKVHILTHRTNQNTLSDERFDDDAATSSLLPESLRSLWRVRIYWIAATCQCAQ
ncbi:uncharacterized protein LOC132261770 [Phlebotomus argentipes]|uniref:uncharacterized protein LOC132261770 n=1 Tax=Phlebotomus argentipes TaxID=94469 RepID=UPI0028930DA8|nr:uncharacterized protein LOC132261770 [Phlebotomus argentipes]